MADQPASFSKGWSATRWRGRRAVAAGELRTLAFVTTVVALMTLFRQVFFAGIVPDLMSLAEFVRGVWFDFRHHLFTALLMFLIIQPVRRLGPQDGVPRYAALVAAVAVAAAAATVVWVFTLILEGNEPVETWPSAPGMSLRFAILAGLLVAVGEFHRAEVRGLEAMRAADANRAALELQTLQARLRVLEAQIEPHFLFNTLANLRRLYETDAAAGEAMLDRLMRYFEIALPSMRSAQSTLDREAHLLESYLELQRVRMGRRLSYGIDIAPALRGLELPPMMLLTLVENSIKHGLAPQREGGRVDVAARLDGATLVLEVSDTGRGFGGDTAGGGTGLANIRARLVAMFGNAAELTLATRDPRGLQATIRLPNGGHADGGMSADRAAPPLLPGVAGAALAAAAGYAPRAVARRASIWQLGLAALTLALLLFFGAAGIASIIMGAPFHAKLALAVELTVMGIVIVVVIVAADEAVDRGTPRAATYALAVAGSALLGALLGWELRAALGLGFVPPGSEHLLNPLQPFLHRLNLAIICVLVGGLATFVHVNRRTAMAARRRQHEAEQARARARRKTLESQLQALQARVEPMFLFGTLERIRQLYRSDTAAAGAMLEDLIVYLRAALPHLRESSSTVAKEMALAKAWLDIVGRSAADRRVEFDIAAAAHEARLPALVMLPLVQQAVGGVDAASPQLRLEVRVAAERLRIDISTSTDAFAAGIEGQPLLEQIDARLRALYGAGARFEATPGDGAAVGSKAHIELPLELDDSEPQGASR